MELDWRWQKRFSGEKTKSSYAVAVGIIDALERDDHEVALKAAAGLRAKREELFGAING